MRPKNRSETGYVYGFPPDTNVFINEIIIQTMPTTHVHVSFRDKLPVYQVYHMTQHPVTVLQVALWTLYQQNQDLIQVGAYELGSNPDLDEAIRLRPEMENLLQQLSEESVSLGKSQDELKKILGDG